MEIIFLDPHKMERLRSCLNHDPEFELAARFMSHNIRLGVGESECIVKVSDGIVTEIKLPPFSEPCDFSIEGPSQSWENLLEPVPPPFYNSLFAGLQRGNFRLTGDLEVAYAYLWAMNRMVDIMRQLQNE